MDEIRSRVALRLLFHKAVCILRKCVSEEGIAAEAGAAEDSGEDGEADCGDDGEDEDDDLDGGVEYHFCFVSRSRGRGLWQGRGEDLTLG